MKKSVKIFSYFLLFIVFLSLVTAHEEKNSVSKENGVKISLILIVLASINAVILVVISCISKKYKRALFLGIVIPIAIATIFLVSSTIITNIHSSSDGPVHWHADYELWACEEKLNVINPTGLSIMLGL